MDTGRWPLESRQWKTVACFFEAGIVAGMKIVRMFRAAVLLVLAVMAFGMTACTEMKEGEANVPDRLSRGLGGGGQFGSSPTGVFEPR